ncbi:nickel-responsive transcriptional regulator NikR [Rhodopseudomonas sp. B29]|uniref:nickel-responsive transcriptional regulator NikR n=1 Tax=Rhodopseudomonas sp. B29 TaxID=95607 RepID=UPI000347B78C|nr:nickel-responsive transcriptional regulator NikR [Rhodopseudomonas sp. B29]
MQRITITLDDDLVDDIDAVIASRGYQNRSEAIRDLVRAGMQQGDHAAEAPGEHVAALVYVYDHNARRLSERLVGEYHDHGELTLATLHVHIDAEQCMEIAALRGPAGEVRHFADHLIAERGVSYGRLVSIPLKGDTKKPTRKPHRHD